MKHHRLSIVILSCLLIPAQAFAAADNDIDSAGNLRLPRTIESDLDNLQQTIAPPGSKEEVAQRMPPGHELRPLSIFKPKELPPQPPVNHAINSVVHVPALHVGELISLASLKGLEMDARYSVPITLKQALEYATYNSLPIKIARASLDYQRWQLLAAIINALPIPSLAMGYSYTASKTLPSTVEKSKVFPLSISYPVFSGGSVVFAALAQYYREQGWRHAYNVSVNDALFDVYQKYNNLVLQQAVLRIRIKAAAVSEAQLRLNNVQYLAGQSTTLAIMQSRAQLESDRQALVDQQVAVRQASLALAFAMNFPMAINVVPADLTLREAHIANEEALIGRWMRTALAKNPSLRQYEMFKLSADRNVTASVSSLYPRFSFQTAYTHSHTIVTPPGGTVGGVAVATITAAQTGLGTATANALGQTASFSPTGSTTANTGISNTVATQVVAASGGQPINLIQSGSIVTSGAATPSIVSSGSGAGNSPNINGSNAPGAGVFGGAVQSVQGVFSGSWSLSNLGLSTMISGAAAEVLAHQAALQSGQDLMVVSEQVRADYCTLVSARARIDNAAIGVISAAESLRLSNLRLSAGTGTNIDAILAQRDYVNALLTQAQAIITSNIAQAQMLHDTGTISVATLTGEAPL